MNLQADQQHGLKTGSAMPEHTKEEVRKTQTDLVAITDAQDLRSHVLGGATHGGQHSARSKELGQAKVGDLDG